LKHDILFSIITVTYNSEKTLSETIESVLNQNFKDFEYIIIDGFSSDRTVEIIKSYEEKFKKLEITFKWISEKDFGIYDAFNKGIKLTEGKWISFIGSDDQYLKNSLEDYSISVKALNKNVDLVHSKVKVGESKIIGEEWVWRRFRRKMNIAHVGAFHNSEYFKKHGIFNTSYKIAGDYEMLLRAKENLTTFWINKITAIMGEGGVSNSQIDKVYRETTKSKIETGKLNYVLSKYDYIVWTIKYKVKTILNALTR